MPDRNGAILVWHHCDGLDPFFEIPDFPTGTWAGPEWHELQFEMHIYNVMENSLDSAHFRKIHGCQGGETQLIDHKGIPLHFDPLTSYPGDGAGIPGEHVISITTWRFYGVGVAEGMAVAEDHGMRLRQLCHFTPEGNKVRFRVSIALDKTTIPEAMHKIVVGANARIIQDNLQQDAPIWKRKGFIARPKLTDSDGPIDAIRRWSCRFFLELAEVLARHSNSPEAIPSSELSANAGWR